MLMQMKKDMVCGPAPPKAAYDDPFEVEYPGVEALRERFAAVTAAKVDTNADGKISVEELSSAQAADHEKLDGEAKEMMQTMVEAGYSQAEGGEVTVEEFTNFMEAQGLFAEENWAWFGRGLEVQEGTREASTQAETEF